MKITTSLLLAVCLTLFLSSYGQKNINLNDKGEETYFSFKVTSKEELKSLSKLISIDNYRNDTVWAYANSRQLQRFSSAGYKINILPHPGDGPGVVMRDQVKLLKGIKTTWNFYPTYDAYVALMTDFQAMYPALCHIETITTLPSGRKILVAKISDNVTIDEAEPEFLYTSSMHGDETTGYVLMLQLIEYLLQNYGSNQEATDLVNNMEIYINPLANPDGTYYGGNNSVSGARRYNINGVDLNRNYPDPEDGDHPDGNAWQPETVAFMNFAGQHDFVAAANFHGGVEVVNYPWDTWVTRSADDDWWQFVSREYADTVHLHSPSTYMDYLNNGVTNGYDWYEVAGGRQDYMNYFHHCREFTIEISNVKLLPAAQLPAHWNYNFRSLILFMKQATYGFRGLITDEVTGLPIEAKISLTGHDNNHAEVYSTALHGDFYRPVKAGTYTVEISAPCYLTQTFTNQTITDYNTYMLNVQLVSAAGVTTSAVTSVTGNTAVSGGEVICEGSSSVSARGVCWSTISNPTLSDAHTSDGAGPGAFVSYISGLSASTRYFVRAYATNGSGTVYGENISFSTSCGAITTFPWGEGFENGGIIPDCWTQEQINNSNVNWTCISGNGSGHPAAAHGGTYNACLKDNSSADNKTLLITPPLNLSGLTDPSLQFWHTQAYWSPDQDELRIFYKTSASGTWILLQTYTGNITAWTLENLVLPNASSDYYIAFEGNAKYGYGVCLDDVQITGTPATLLVTPQNQDVGAAAGTIEYAVESNSAWTATSNQLWCSVTPAGNGDGVIAAVYDANTTGFSRIAEITITVNGIEPMVVTLTQEGLQEKQLNLIVFLEGLFNGSAMNKAQNENGDQFADNIADEIQVELHEATEPYLIAGGLFTAALRTDGTAQLSVPASLNMDYFIVIKHRNSLETWSSSPVSFSSASISYNFTTTASQAFGNNLKQMSGVFVIYGGDVNQDGVVDSADMTPVDNDAAVYLAGYLPADVNGDGIIDTADITIIDNNSASYTGVIAP
ncbi:MAG: M14 family zinc carboxypeptidase [Lentimicrobium sp.]